MRNFNSFKGTGQIIFFFQFVFFLLLFWNIELYSFESFDGRIILLTSNQGLLLSEDNGKTWKNCNAGLPGKIVPKKIKTDKDENLYLITRGSGIYKFGTENNRWIDLNSAELLEPTLCSQRQYYRNISAFAVNSLNVKTLTLATKHSIFIKRPGKTWTGLFQNRLDNYATALAVNFKGDIYYGTSYDGIYKVNKSGSINIRKGLPREQYSKTHFFYEEIAEIEFNDNNHRIMYCALNFGGGVFISRDAGKSWESLNFSVNKNSLRDIYDLKYKEGNLYVSTGEAVYRMNAGGAWSKIFLDDMFKNLARVKENLSLIIFHESKNIPPLFCHLNDYKLPMDNKSLTDATRKKAIYTNVYSLKKKISSHLKTIKQCGFNSIVIDMKDDWGDICFDSKNKTAIKIGAVKKYVNVKNIVNILKKNNVYAIARIVVFKDKRLYNAYNHKYSIWDKKKNLPWKGNPREYWNDPYSEFVRNYNIEISEELQKAGFDEIQFDYIRFPSDGPIWKCLYRYKKNKNIYKSEIIACFLKDAKSRISIPISIDIYGFNAWHRYGSSIGQDVEKFSEIVDVVCPMIYPSHYGKKFFMDGPRHLRPYKIVFENIRRAKNIIKENAIIRPYLQAFNLLSPTWGPEYINNQVRGAIEGGSSGYIFWNARGKYKVVKKAFSGSEKKR